MYNFDDLKYITYRRLTDSPTSFFPFYFFREDFTLTEKRRKIIKEVLV